MATTLKTLVRERLRGTRAEDVLLRAVDRRAGRSRLDRIMLQGELDEGHIVRVLERRLRADSNCIDAGCNRGDFLNHLVQMCPAGRHIAVEPQADLAELVRRRFPQVEVLQVALSDETGTATFNVVKTTPSMSGFRQLHYFGRSEELATIEVQTRTLDSIVPPEHDVAFIKMDVEGAELAVLRGASAVLKRCRPVIYFECFADWLRAYSTTPLQIHSLLSHYGMRMYLPSDLRTGRGPLSPKRFVRCATTGVYQNFVASYEDL